MGAASTLTDTLLLRNRFLGFLPSIPKQRTGNWWPQNDQLRQDNHIKLDTVFSKTSGFSRHVRGDRISCFKQKTRPFPNPNQTTTWNWTCSIDTLKERQLHIVYNYAEIDNTATSAGEILSKFISHISLNSSNCTRSDTTQNSLTWREIFLRTVTTRYLWRRRVFLTCWPW